MANNQAKYQQSCHKPFLQSPFMEEFGFKGLTTASQAVLGGVYETESHIDLCMKAFIKELIMPQEFTLQTKTPNVVLQHWVSIFVSQNWVA
jgi:hypothetical protein